MTDSRVEIDSGTSGEYIDAVQLNTNSGTVERQRIAIGDAVQPENNLVINADGSASVSGYVTVSGSVSVLNPSSGSSAASVSILNLPNTQAVSGSVTAIPYGTQTVAGSVGVSNFPGSFTISNFPATQPVSGSVSVLDFPANQTVSGSVGVNNFPGSFVVSNLPGVQAVSGSVSVLDFPANQVVSGSISVLNPTTSVNVSASVSVASVAVTVASVVALGGTVNVGNFPAIQPVSQSGFWGASVSNFPVNQVVSGSVSVLNSSGSSGPASVSVLNGFVDVVNFPATQVISGTVNAQQQGNYGASISNFPTTQAVSGSVSVLNGISAEVVSGSVGVTNFPGSFAVNNFPATQAISGSVTAIPYGVQGISGSVSVTNGHVIIDNALLAASVQGTLGLSPTTVVGSYQVGNYGASISNLPATQTIAGSVQALPSSADIGYVGTWATGSPIAGQTSSSVKAVPLTTNSYPSTNGILVQGLSTNIASVFVGASTVASVGVTGGFEIQAGQAVPQTAANANLVYVIGPNNSDSVCWTVL